MLRAVVVLAVATFLAGTAAGEWGLSEMVTKRGERVRYHAKPVANEFINWWPDELEAEFQARAHEIIAAQTPWCMAKLHAPRLGGRRPQFRDQL